MPVSILNWWLLDALFQLIFFFTATAGSKESVWEGVSFAFVGMYRQESFIFAMMNRFFPFDKRI